MPDPVTTSKQQERCTCGTNAEGNPTECQIHGPELFKSHPAQPVEQAEREHQEALEDAGSPEGRWD